MIYLRPHHGLCIQHFIGKGYSQEFIDNMKNTIEFLESKENVEITLTCGVDIICGCCPNNNEGVCLSSKKTSCYDNRCLRICDLNEGNILLWRNFKRIVQDSILKVDKLKEVCTECTWLSICKKLDK
jgi:hypothetical protein